MNNYQVFIEGSNFLLKSGNDSGLKQGFKTIRLISAESEEAAEKMAIEKMREENFLKRSVLNKREDPPLLYVTRVTETESKEANPLAEAIQFYAELDGDDDEY